MLKFLSFVFGFAVPHQSQESIPAESRLSKSSRTTVATDDADRHSAGTSRSRTNALRAGGLRAGGLRAGGLRAAALATAIVPIALMLVASRLEPASQGLGTHQQLGLPPCSMRVLFGIRCPSCGMTTSWAHFTRGEWLSSFQVNPGGFLLACFSIAVACLALLTCWSGQLPTMKTQKIVTVTLVTIAAATLVDWMMRLVAG